MNVFNAGKHFRNIYIIHASDSYQAFNEVHTDNILWKYYHISYATWHIWVDVKVDFMTQMLTTYYQNEISYLLNYFLDI